MTVMSPTKVTLVSNDVDGIQQFRIALCKAGSPCTLAVYENGLAALGEIPNDDKPDLIVLDWFLPVVVTDWFLPILDAPEFIAEMKNIEGLERIPIAILMSSDWCLHHRFTGSAAPLCLSKPVTEDQIRNLLTVARTSPAPAQTTRCEAGTGAPGAGDLR